MGKHTQSIDTKILDRVRATGPGHAFTPADFVDLGSRTAVDKALSRNCQAGALRRVARGIYDLPEVHPLLGQLATPSDAIARALAGRDAARLQPTGAYAANVLGLSEQVPVRIVFLTDGRSRRVTVGKREIVLKHTTLRNMTTAGRISGTVIHALRWLGRRHVDDQVTSTLRRQLTAADRRQLLQDLRYAPAWVAAVMRKVAEPDES